MLVELSVMEQRCHLVMEVVSGAPGHRGGPHLRVSRQAGDTVLGYRPAHVLSSLKKRAGVKGE